MANGDAVSEKLRGDRTGGIPWIVILDGEGTELVSSDGPNGNVGCPITTDERAYFVTMVEQTIQHAPAARSAEIGEALDRFAKEKYPNLAE